MPSFRRTASLLAATAAIAIVACTSSDARSPADPSRTTFGLIEGLIGLNADTTITVFAIDPQVTATYVIGNTHRLRVQHGGVCVLSSTYGIGTWDDPCIPATLPILVTARSWTDSLSHPHIEFSPDLRFAPLDGLQAAELYMSDGAASLDQHTVMLHCRAGQCVDESLADSTLVTGHDGQQGFVYRRIKHFSGYQVASGRDADSTETSARVSP